MVKFNEDLVCVDETTSRPYQRERDLTGFHRWHRESLVDRRAGDHPDALTYYTRPAPGAYYFIPSTDSLRRDTGA